MTSTKKACLVLAIALSGCQPERDDWMIFGASEGPQFNETYSYKKDSIEAFEAKSNASGASRIVSIVDNRSKSTRVRFWHILKEDCKSGYGKVVSTEIDGKAWVNTYDYAQGDGSIVSTGAEILCDSLTK